MTNKRSFLLVLALVLRLLSVNFSDLQGQSTGAFDCINAQPICTSQFPETDNRSTTAGDVIDEIEDGATCMFDGDESGIVWYSFKVATAGQFGFIITPSNADDDFDWALFDITEASCDDLRRNAGSLLVSCNAAGGPGCHGATGMSAAGQYNIQGGGCDTDPPSISAGNTSINALIPVQAGNTYVLAVQNWSFLGSGVFQGYDIDFGPSINTGVIDIQAPEITEISPVGTICDQRPVSVTLNDNIKCETINRVSAVLTGPGGITITGDVFAPDCIRGARSVREFFLVSNDLKSSPPGTYIVRIDDTQSNREGLVDECGNPMELPIEFEIELEPDLSLNVTIQQRQRNNNFCDGQRVTLRAAETFDFLGTNNLYTWTLPDGATFVGRDVEVNQTGTYSVEVILNKTGCKRGRASFIVPNDVTIDLGTDRTGLCAGTTETIQAQAGGNSYTWSNGQTGQTINVTQSGTYSVVVQTNCGPVTDEIVIEYNDIPYNPAQTNFTICPGDPVTIGAADIGGGVTYTWSNGATTATTTVDAEGSYIVTVRQGACSIQRTINVAASAVPNVRIAPASMGVCSGETTTLTALDDAQTGATFRWSNGVTSPSQNVEAGTYMVTATTAAGCEDIATITINDFVVAQATVNGQTNFNDDICSDEMTFLIASTGNSYLWSNGSTEQRINAAPGTYNVVVTDANGCTSRANATVTGVALPTITIAQAAGCAQDRLSYSVGISTQNGNTISTAGNVGTISGSAGNFTISGIPEGQSVTVFSVNGIGCDEELTITAPSCGCPPVAAPNVANPTITVCDGQPIPPLTANTTEANTEIRWYNVASGGTPIFIGNSFSQTTPGTYFAEVFNTVTECESQRVQVRLVINDLPAAVIIGAAQVCPGGNTTLNASLATSSAMSFAWSNNTTGPSVNIGRGTYSVTIADVNGCEDIATQTVSDFTVAEVTIDSADPNQSVCPGATTTLTASAGSRYEWNTGNTNQSITEGRGTFVVTVTDTNGCENEGSITIGQEALPTITPVNSGDCSGDRQSYSIRVNTEANNTMTSTSGTVTGGGGFFTVQGVTAGEDIIVIVTNPAGCQETLPIEAPNCACPPLSAPASNGSTDRTICATDAIPTLSMSTAGLGADDVIRWYDVSSGGSSLSTGANFTPTAAGTYFAEVFNTLSNCNSSRTQVRVTINASPVATIGGDREVCPGTTTQLNANIQGGGATAFQWSADAGNSNSPNITRGVGTYSVVVTDANGCTDEANITIDEYNVVPTTISGPNSVCEGETITLTANNGTSYAWSNSGSSNTVNVAAGSYTVIATDGNGCTTEATQGVSEDALPTISLPNNGDCSGDRQSYDIRINTQANNTISTSLGTTSGGGGFFTVRDVPAGEQISVTITNDAGCEMMRTIPAPDCSCPDLVAPQSTNTNVAVCSDQPIPALSVGTANLGEEDEIRWYNTDSGGTAVAVGGTFTPTAAGTYFAEVYNTLSNCTSTRTSVRLTINATPTAIISGDNAVCPGGDTPLSASLQGGGATAFQWSASANGSNSPMVTRGEGTYSVVVTDGNGCTDEATINVTEFVVAEATITGAMNVCPGNMTTLTASIGENYQWNNFNPNRSLEVEAGSYSVIVTDVNGCTTTADATVVENEVPTISLPASAECDDDLVNYSIRVNIDANDILTTSAGNVTGGGGFMTIRDIPAGQNITLTVENTEGCIVNQVVSAADCTCPPLAAPQSTGNRSICADEAIPALTIGSAGIDSESEVRWYNVSTGGTAIATGLNFTPTAAGTYFAEIYNTTSNCKSQREEVRLIINSLPTANIAGTLEVCPNNLTRLDASLAAGNANSFQWSSNANNALTSGVDVGPGIYTVSITDGNNCLATASRTVSEFAVTAAAISGDVTVCPTETTVLTATAGSSYAWSNFGTGSNVTVGTGDYSVTVTDANGCTSIATEEVTEDAVPSLTESAAAECSDDLETYVIRINTESGNILTTTLGTVGGGGGFFNVSDITKDIPVTVTVTDPNTTCTSSQTIAAPDCSCPPTAAPQSMGNVEVCADATIPAISISGAGVNAESEIRWYNDATSNNAIATGLSFTPSQAGSYYAEIFNTTTACQSGRTEVQLIINAVPTANIAGASEACPGIPTTLEANLSGGSVQSYQWSASANNALSPTVTVDAGTYSVTITDDNGCVAEDTQEISEFVVTAAAISGDATVCPTETTVLTASAGSSYAWSNFGTGSNVSVGTGTYMVTVTDANGCESVASETVTEDALPRITSPEAAACSDDLETYSIRINTESGNTLTTTLGTVGGGGGFFNVRDIPADIPITVTVENPETGCSSSQSFNAPDCSCPQTAAPQAMGNTVICSDEAIPAISVSGAGVNEESEIRWYSDATANTEIATGLSFTPSQAGSYYAEIYNTTTGCQSGRTEVQLIINAVPSASIVGSSEVCPGIPTTLEANLSAGSAQSYQWSASANNALSPTVTVDAGTYSVTITDDNGCVAEDTQEISEFVVTAAAISGDATVCPTETTVLTASAGSSYAWSNFGTGSNVTVETGTYMVTVTDANGCESVASETVTEDALPSITSPEAAACSDDLETYSIRINTESGNTLTTTLGTVGGGGGFFNVRDIPADIPITVTVENPETGCSSSQSFNAPDCSCPQTAAPQAMGNTVICSDEAIPAISVSGAGVNEESEIRWYSDATANTEIATGLSFTPSQAGSYYAEIYNTTTGCQSGRTELQLIINAVPSASIVGSSEVCPGIPTTLEANLSAGSAQSYQWSASANNALSPTVTVDAGTYSVTITDDNGCVAEDTQEISEFVVTAAAISGDATVCPTETTVLTASAGSSYAWSNFGTGSNVSVGTGTYMVTVTDANGCESVANETVTEDALPSITSPQAAECSDDLSNYTIRINTESGNTLTTTLGTVGGGGGFFNVRDIPADIPITVTVENPETGCSSSQSFNAPDCSCPQTAAPQSMGDIAICADEAILAISVSGAGVNEESEIRWYSDATANTEIATGLSFTPTQAGSYYAEIFNITSGCQSGRTEVRLIINEVPDANIEGASQVCPDTEIELTASLRNGTASSFEWSSSADGVLSPSVSVGAGTYMVTVTDENNCTGVAELEITEFAVTQASISGDLTVCPDLRTVLTASAGSSYAWSNFGTGSDVTVSVGTFTVSVTDNNNCESIASATITEDALPSIELVDGLLDCSEDLASYGFQINTDAANELTTSLGTVSGSGGIFTVSDVIADVPVTITVTNPTTECVSTQSFDAPDCSCPPTSAPQSMGDMEICANETIPAISVSGAGVNAESEVRWYDVATGGVAISTGLDFTPTQAGTYFAEIANIDSGCQSARTEVRLVVNALPTANIGGASQVCPAEEVELSASLLEGNASIFAWSNNASTPTISAGAGTYSVTITDANDCIAERSIEITEFEVAEAMITGNEMVCPDEMTVLTASTGASYAWSNFAESNDINAGVGTFTVTVTDNNSCESVASATISQHDVPSITLVNGLLDCNSVTESYGFQISTEAGNELSVSLGDVNGADGTFTVTNVANEIPVTVMVTNPITGCISTQIFDAPDCSCPQIAAPQSMGDATACEGDDLPALSVSDMGIDEQSEVRWYDVATSGIAIGTGLSFTPTQAGTYFAEIFNVDSNCQSPRTEVRLVVNAIPDANIAGGGQVCPSTTTELSANLATGTVDSYLWSTSAASATTQTVELGPGIYTVTITDTNGCITTASRVVEELPAAVAMISGTSAVCPDGEADLTASGGTSFEWSDFTQSSTATLGVGDHSVTVTDTNGCTDIATIEVTQESVPSLTLVDNLLQCAGDLETYNFQINTEVGNEVTTTLGTVSGTDGLFTISDVTKELAVTITITNTTGCVSTQTFQAPDCNCEPTSAPSSDGDVAICAGEEIPALIVSDAGSEPGAEIRWYMSAASNTVIATGVSFTPTAAGEYFAEVFNTETGCASSRQVVTLTIREEVTATINGASEICDNPDILTELTVDFTGGTADTYQWSESVNNATTPSVVVQAGDYSVTVTDTDGCSAETSFSVGLLEANPVIITGDLMVCPDNETMLTAENGASFTWSNGETTESIEVGIGTYSVSAFDGNGCPSDISVTVEEQALPSLTLSSQAACADDLESYGLEIITEDGNIVTASLGTVTNNAGIVSITDVTPEMPITIIINNPTTGCMIEQNFAAPNCNCPDLALPAVSENASVCIGDAIPTLTATSPDLNETIEMRWYDADIDSNLLATGTEFTPTEAGTYFAEVFETSSDCSSARIPVTLTINELPNVTINGVDEICPATSTSLMASGGVDFAWDNGETTASIDVPVGDYMVIGTDANGCSAEASFSVSEHTVAAVSITGDLGVCTDDMTTLTASAGESFQWDNGETTASIDVGVGIYNLVVTDANGCESITSTEVLQDPAPNFSVAQQADCSPDLSSYGVQLQTAAGNTLTSTGGTLNDLGGGLWSISQVDTSASIIVTIEDTATGCITEVPFTAPNCNCPTFAAPTNEGDATICSGETIPSLTVSNIEEGLIVNWYDAPVGGNLLAEGTASFQASAAGIYYAEAIDVTSACASLRTAISLTINELPDVAIVLSAAGACENDIISLTGRGATSYTWSSNETGENIDVTPGTYTVTGVDANGCENTASVSLISFPTPSVTTDAEEFICGAAFDIVTASGGDTYAWSTGATGATVQLETGSYMVTATNTEGCTDITEFTINAAVEAVANLGENQILCDNESIALSPGTFPAGAMTYEWSNGASSSSIEVSQSGQYAVTVTDICDNQATANILIESLAPLDAAALEAVLGQDTTLCVGQIAFDAGTIDFSNSGTVDFRWQDGSNKDRLVATQAGTYTLMVFNECEDIEAEVEVEDCEECKFYLPNAFSPNGDLNNDGFRIFSNCELEITNYQMRIFDRWGGLIFESTDITESWDGRFQDTRPVTDAFVWTIYYDLPDRYGSVRSHTESGEVTIQD